MKRPSATCSTSSTTTSRSTDDATRTYLAGDAKWTTSNNRSIQSGKSYTFTFTPDDKSYAPVDGSVKIYLDVASGDIELVLKKDVLYAKDEDVKLRSLLSDLKKIVKAYDDNGDEVRRAPSSGSATTATPLMTAVNTNSNLSRAAAAMIPKKEPLQ